MLPTLIGADPREIVWTSVPPSPTTSPSRARRSFYKSKGKHLITVKTEHKAVLDTCRELERQGFEVTYLDVQPDGLVDLDAFKAAIRPDTILASVMFVNNEIGVIQDIAAIGAICREKRHRFPRRCRAGHGPGGHRSGRRCRST
jgi:cysteine desulfurase